MADIREKIKKLLALSESPNENEARAALLKAKELMAQHKLTDNDFNKEEAKLVKMECEDIKWTTDSGNVWMVDLCTLIANNYCCTAAWATVKGSRTHELVLVGFEDDVRVCGEVIAYAIGFITGQVLRLSKKHKNQPLNVIRSSYAIGFIKGLEIAYELQKEEHPEWALVVVKPKEVQEYESTLGSRDVKTKKVEFDGLAYMKGQNDGASFNAGKILGSAM